MFTGLVAECGLLSADPKRSPQGGVLLALAHSEVLGERLEIGASLAVSGVCLTIVETGGGRSTVELSPETLRRTTLAKLSQGDAVNLEPSLRLGDPLGGHWVQGHVDGTVEVVERRDRAEHSEIAFGLPASLAPFVVEKGSIAIDGVSLTISALIEPEVAHGSDETRARATFEVALIPHTLGVTTLSALAAGSVVNVEVDILAKYVQRSVQASLPRPG